MWYIMSYNSYAGVISGVFQELDGTFMVGHSTDDEGNACIDWTPVISKHDFIFVKCAHDGVMRRVDDDWALKEQERRVVVTRRLTRGTITKRELVEMAASPIAQDAGLTWREQKIIELMAKEA